jgi:hypothetical protein
MKRFAILLVGLCAGMAMAQLYPSKLGLLGSAAFRVAETRVKTELHISDEQGTSISKLMTSHAAQQQAISKQLAKATQDQVAALQAKLDKAESATAKGILNVLQAPQRERLMQLAIQDAGIFALKNGEVAKKVGLTPEQKTKIQAISASTVLATDELGASMAEQLQAVPQGKAGDAKRKSIAKSLDLKTKQAEAKGESQILALLSKAQVAKWKSLKGKAFKL